MNNTAHFVEFIVYCFHNNYQPFFLLHGRPVTLEFRANERLAIGLPSCLKGNPGIDALVKGGEGDETSAILSIRDEGNDSTVIRLNAIAKFDNGEKPIATDATDVVIEPSAVSFYCLGPAK